MSLFLDFDLKIRFPRETPPLRCWCCSRFFFAGIHLQTECQGVSLESPKNSGSEELLGPGSLRMTITKVMTTKLTMTKTRAIQKTCLFCMFARAAVTHHRMAAGSSAVVVSTWGYFCDGSHPLKPHREHPQKVLRSRSSHHPVQGRTKSLAQEPEENDSMCHSMSNSITSSNYYRTISKYEEHKCVLCVFTCFLRYVALFNLV